MIYRRCSCVVLPIASLVMLVLSACSGMKSKDSENVDVIPTAADANTDAVPVATPEVPPAEKAPVPSPTEPAPTAQQTASSGQTESYSVKSGDTLMKIAFETYGDVYKWKDIYNENKDQVQDPNVITEGTVLKLAKAESLVIDRNGERYLIKRGDTLGTISEALYGTKDRWKDLWANNKQLIHNPDKIFAGFYLYYVPSAPVAAAPSGAAAPASIQTLNSAPAVSTPPAETSTSAAVPAPAVGGPSAGGIADTSTPVAGVSVQNSNAVPVAPLPAE